MSKKLSLKVLLILTLVMGTGFTILGGMSLYLEYRTIMNYERNSAKDWATSAISSIETAMASGDLQSAKRSLEKIKSSTHILTVDIYDAEGKSTSTKLTNPDMVEALRNGRQFIKEVEVKGSKALVVSYPMMSEAKCRKCHPNAGKYLGGISLTKYITNGTATAKHLATLLSLAGITSFILMIAALYIFMQKVIVKRIADVSEQIQALAEGEGDLTVALNERSEDEIGRLVAGVSKLITTLRDILGNLYVQAGHIAISSCKITASSTKLSESTASQRELAYSVAVASEEMAATINEVSLNTHHAASLSQEIQTLAGDGIRSMDATVESTQDLRENIVDTMEIMNKLEESSNAIGNIISIIDDIAEQTNLLALNASIEAARAGSAGKGFAVVANEVKVLSSKTANSTREISEIIKSIQMEISNAKTAVYTGQNQAEDGVSKARETQQKMQTILDKICESAAMINQIAVATEEQSQTTAEISDKIAHVSESAATVREMTETTVDVFKDVSEASQQIYATVSRFNVGNYHNQMCDCAKMLQEQIEARLTEAVDSGEISLENLFDRDHQQIPHTNPPKYTTRFDRFFDENISRIQEEILEMDGRIIFAIAVDDKGYCPTHNRKFSQHQGGSGKNGLSDRAKRIYNDRTGARAAENLNGSLLQTYLRDSGEIMNDISLPIYIKGKHWGAVRVAYFPQD